jgi:hypothetical protein
MRYLDCLSESRRMDSISPGWIKNLGGLLMVVIPLVAIGCSNSTGPSSCRVLADEAYNPWDYLGWRSSRNARFSSITHALPCSAYVASTPSTTATPDAIADCPARDQRSYYELIGKYDQFISGWDDVVDMDGNRVTATQVDSAENYQSELRLDYEKCRN